MAKYRFGFLDFGTDDEDIAIQDSLTQAAGVEVSYSVDQGLGNQLIDSDGFDPNGDKARYYNLVGVPNYLHLFQV